jgi:hypothetical protein
MAEDFSQLISEIHELRALVLELGRAQASPWLTPEQAAARVGISRRTFSDRVASGFFLRHTVDGIPRYHRDEVDAAVLGKLSRSPSNKERAA